MKYKVGDEVVIKKDLKEDGGYTYYVTDDMVVYAGKEAIITEVSIEDSDYKINLDEGYWEWTDDMFEDSKSNEKENIISSGIIPTPSEQDIKITVNEKEVISNAKYEDIARAYLTRTNHMLHKRGLELENEIEETENKLAKLKEEYDELEVENDYVTRKLIKLNKEIVEES